MKLDVFFKQKDGYTLIWTIIVMVVLVILGTSLLSVSIAEVRHAARSESQIKVDYIARSGVEVGFKKLVNAGIEGADTIQELALAAQALNQGYADLGDGQYNIVYSYDNDQPSFIKIESSARHNGNENITSTLALYVHPQEGFDNIEWKEAPNTWKRSMNLWDDVDPDDPNNDPADEIDQTGEGINITGFPTKSPQNSDDESRFRATVMRFSGRGKDDITFIQQNNTNNIIFDAEVLIFGGGIRLRHNRTGENHRYVKFDMSDVVLSGEMEPWTYTGSVGFENENRYIDFLGDAPFDSGVYNSYGFNNADSNSKFGLVAFGGDLKRDDQENATISALAVDFNDISTYKLYFFKRGIDINRYPLNINNSVPSGDVGHYLIEVREDDPIYDSLSHIIGVGKYTLENSRKMFYEQN